MGITHGTRKPSLPGDLVNWTLSLDGNVHGTPLQAFDANLSWASRSRVEGLMPRIILMGRSIAASSLVSCDTGARQTSKAYFSLAPTS
eukprot:g74110.t1